MQHSEHQGFQICAQEEFNHVFHNTKLDAFQNTVDYSLFIGFPSLANQQNSQLFKTQKACTEMVLLSNLWIQRMLSNLHEKITTGFAKQLCLFQKKKLLAKCHFGLFHFKRNVPKNSTDKLQIQNPSALNNFCAWGNQDIASSSGCSTDSTFKILTKRRTKLLNKLQCIFRKMKSA